MELIKELYTEYDEIEVDLISAIEESLKESNLLEAKSSASKLFLKNPGITIAAASLALDAYSKYKQNKRNTIRLFAKDPYEKRMMTDIVQSLTDKGKFKLLKTSYADGGQHWVLKRI